jgi:hypothetical protein
VQYLDKVLTVDPGIHTGFAYWQNDLYPKFSQFNVRTKQKNLRTEEQQLSDLNIQFGATLAIYLPKLVLIEGVEFWEGSMKSLASAKRQNLSKLAYIVGMYSSECLHYGIEFRIIPARVWKGQMTDDILARKIFNLNKKEYPTEHILNAVGIGFSTMGCFLNTKNQPSRAKKFKISRRIWA